MGLNEQQEILKRTAREFLEAECPTSLVREIEAGERGYSPELWKKMSELGWLGMALPPEHGGGGGNLVDQVVLFEELGRAIVPSPILTSTVLSGQTLLRGASEEQKGRLIPGIAGGDTVVTVATTGTGAGLDGVAPTVNGVIEGGHFVINGTAIFVPYAHLAEYILCPVETTDGQTLFLMESQTPGITMTLLESVANYKQHEVHFNDVIVPEENMIGQVGLGADPLRKAGEWATVVQCGELVGRAEKVLEMVVEYSKVRVQFGRAIGSFQAVQHRCADLRVAIDGARLLTHQAAWKLSEGQPGSLEVSMAKAYAGSVSRQATVAGHSIFAGIAFAVEHDMQLYTMRSKIGEANLGDTDFHLDRVGHHMGN